MTFLQVITIHNLLKGKNLSAGNEGGHPRNDEIMCTSTRTTDGTPEKPLNP